MPEHPHIPSREEFPHTSEPYRQGYAPIARRREPRAKTWFYRWAPAVVLAALAYYLITQWVQL